MESKIYIVEINDVFDFNGDTTMQCFETKKQAKDYFNKTLKKIDKSRFDTKIEKEDFVSYYNKGYYSENHFEMGIIEKNVIKAKLKW